MVWRTLRSIALLLVTVLVVGVVGAGGYGLVRYVIRPAANTASGPVPIDRIRAARTGPDVTFAPTTTTVAPKAKVKNATPAERSLLAATNRLDTTATGMRPCVVVANGSYEGATYDQYGHIDFWQDRAGRWVDVAQRLYPPDSGNGSANYSSTGGVSVSGQVLVGATEPIFIVTGRFSPDASENSVAFADGPSGWGVVIPQANGQLASDGQSLTNEGIGLQWGLRFVAGRLETLSRPSAWTTAFDSEFPVIRLWSWSDNALDLVSSNVVTAQVSSEPDIFVGPVPVGSTPPNGTYAAQLSGVTTMGSSVYPLLRLDIDVGYIASGCVGGADCFLPSGVETSVVVGATTPTSFWASSYGRSLWILGPAWGLAVPDGLCCGAAGAQPAAAQLGEFGATGWYIPSELSVSAFVEEPEPIIEVTFSNGEATAVAEPPVYAGQLAPKKVKAPPKHPKAHGKAK